MGRLMATAKKAMTREADGRAYRPSRAEQETVIRWDREGDQVHVWSAAPAIWRKMARLGLPPVRETVSYGRRSGCFYRTPLSRFRWGLKRRGARAPGRRLAVQTSV